MTVVTTQEQFLKIEYYFVDGDTRTQTINNARSDVTASEIRELQALIRQGNLLIGDKNQATFGKISKAIYTVRATTKGIEATQPVQGGVESNLSLSPDTMSVSQLSPQLENSITLSYDGTPRKVILSGYMPPKVKNIKIQNKKLTLNISTMEYGTGSDTAVMTVTLPAIGSYKESTATFTFTGLGLGSAVPVRVEE